jgi:hypothetical protein
MRNTTPNLTGTNINSQPNLLNEIGVVEIPILGGRVGQENGVAGVVQGQQIEGGILRAGEALLIRDSQNNIRQLVEAEQRRINHIIGDMNPQYDSFNSLRSSVSAGVPINRLSQMALYSLALTTEAIAGIACYCSVKFPENAMNGANITGANITGANITGANILGNATETSGECMKEIMPIGILVALALVGFVSVGEEIIKSFKVRREGEGARNLRTQGTEVPEGVQMSNPVATIVNIERSR